MGKEYREISVPHYVKSFSNHIGSLFKISDLAVARAGASTITELASVGLPAILVPFARATDDHQTENARSLEKAGGAVVVPEKEFNGSTLCKKVSELLENDEKRNKMAEASALSAQRDAAELLCNFVLET